jgi:Lon protease-like protein
MGQRLLPLFPLQVVLLPRTPLPLHIFEDRYKEMFADVLREDSEFGVVLITDKGICNMGCTAIVDEILQRYDDGRIDLLATGRRRFEIRSLDDDKSYLRGDVEFFDDDEFETPSADTTARAMSGFEALRGVEELEAEPQMSDPQLSFQLALPISDLDFRQLLLSTRSEAVRMKQLADFFPGYIVRQRHKLHVKSVAPHNGHGKWPPGA